MPGPAASAESTKIVQLRGGNGNPAAIPAFIRADFAAATRDVLYAMAIIMAVAGVVALLGLRSGVQEDTEAAVRTGPGDRLSGQGTEVGLDPAQG